MLCEPGALRNRVREQPFRPLATSTDLPVGWCVEVADPAMLHAIVETVYPGAVADWSASARGMFRTNTLKEVAARQTGMYRAMATLDPAVIEAVAAQVCGRCVRQPTWLNGQASPIPCKEACNLWMTSALEAVDKT
jgi:hypothetical protein